jgi:hypothetical protein
MSAPIFRDPIADGAADPVVVRHEGSGALWMFYTNRQPHEAGGKRWIHGSPIGVAVSSDGGASWSYRGTVEGLDAPEDEPGRNTHWAPEVIRAEGRYHMYLSYVPGIPDDWNAPRTITHFVSDDLVDWTRIGPLTLSSDKVIDACVFHCPDGLWRLWYKDERHGSGTYVASSRDLFDWTVEGCAIAGSPHAAPHEGPNVFALGGHIWMIVDEWRGQGVYRSQDAINWTRQGLIGDQPGVDVLDQKLVRHADVVVHGGHAALYYFTHPLWDEASQDLGPVTVAARKTAIHQGLLTVRDGVLVLDRNVPADLALLA